MYMELKIESALSELFEGSVSIYIEKRKDIN